MIICWPVGQLLQGLPRWANTHEVQRQLQPGRGASVVQIIVKYVASEQCQHTHTHRLLGCVRVCVRVYFLCVFRPNIKVNVSKSHLMRRFVCQLVNDFHSVCVIVIVIVIAVV